MAIEDDIFEANDARVDVPDIPDIKFSEWFDKINFDWIHSGSWTSWAPYAVGALVLLAVVIWFARKKGWLAGHVASPNPRPRKDAKFQPVGGARRMFEGGDNGITAVAANGTVAMIIGDMPIPNEPKAETGVFELPPGEDPVKQSDWHYKSGHRGKCYGATYIGNDLVMLRSDKGSMWTGVQNCRVRCRGKMSETLQKLCPPPDAAAGGGNYFIVQQGPGHKYSTWAYIGCLRAQKQKFWELETPVTIWKVKARKLVDPDKLSAGDFHMVPEAAAGLISTRNSSHGNHYAVFCSITYVPEKNAYAAVIGRFVNAGLDYFTGQLDKGFERWGSEKPDFMEHKRWRPPGSKKNETFISGAFTQTYFKARGNWYRAVTGSGTSHNDAVFIQRIKWV